MIDAGDVDESEPSWGVLGRMIQETNFVQVQQRADFMINSWGVDANDFIHQTHLLVADHPYAAVIECYRFENGTNTVRCEELLKDIKIVDATYAVLPLYYLIPKNGDDDKTSLHHQTWMQVYNHADSIAQDMEFAIRMNLAGTAKEKSKRGLRLLQVSPKSPVAMGWLITVDWENAQAQAAQWNQNYGEHPAVSAAFARRYTKLEQWEEAENSLRKYIAKAPDRWAFLMLADNYLAQGNEDQWKQTLEDYLKHEDYGLSHARVRVMLAEHFMERGDHKQALPYALEAAESWAGWAMVCAAACYEGLRACLRSWRGVGRTLAWKELPIRRTSRMNSGS